MKLTTADNKKIASLVYAIHDAGEQHSLTQCALQGYSHFETAQAVHQEHKGYKL